MSRTSRAALAVVTNYASTVIVALAGFVLVPIVLRFVTRDDYGLWTTLGQLFAYLNLLDFGVGSALIRRTAQARAMVGGDGTAGSEAVVATGTDDADDRAAAVSRALSTALVIFSGLGVAVLLVGLVFGIALPRLIPLPASQIGLARTMLAILVVYTALSFPLRAALKTLHGIQEMASANVIAMFEGLVTPALTLLLLAAGVGLLSLPVAAAAAGLVAGGLAFWRLRSRRPPVQVSWSRVSRDEARGLFGWSALLWLNSLAVIVIYQTDNVVVASQLGLGSAATYALTTRLPLYALPVIVVLADACVPAAVELCAQGRLDRVREVYLRVLRVTGALAVGAAVVATAINGRFVTLWVGADNNGGWWLTVLTAAILVYRVLMQTASMVILGVGRIRGVVAMSLAEAALNLVLSLWWARSFGLAGVAAGTLVAGLATSGWYVTWFTSRQLGLSAWPIAWRGAALPLLCAVPAGLVALALRGSIAAAGWPQLAGLGALIGVVYTVTTLVVGMSDEERAEIWQGVRRRGWWPSPVA